MISLEPANDCPCGSTEAFAYCCQKYISDKACPETPEQLMRSRYSAYVLKNENYLLKSWHKSTRPMALDLKHDTSIWKKLKIISAKNDKVAFVAYFINLVNGKEQLFSLYEESQFVKETHWFYLEGIDLRTTELSKNMLCPCQSGKKFKRCCSVAM